MQNDPDKRFDKLLEAMAKGEAPKRPSRPADQKANEEFGEKPRDAE